MRNLLAKVVLVILPAGCDSVASNKDESPPRVSGSPPKIQAMGSEPQAPDETFLSENWKRLCEGGQPNYDPKSGILEVAYDFGDLLKKDVLFPRGPIPEKHLVWKDRFNSGMTFHGNTSGFFCLPFPFKDTVEFEYRVKIAVMRNDASLTAVLMCSPNGMDYLGANFGTVELWQDGSLRERTPPTDPSRRRSPNYWFSKAGIPGVLMRVTLEPHPNGGSSMVKI